MDELGLKLILSDSKVYILYHFSILPFREGGNDIEQVITGQRGSNRESRRKE